MFRFKTYYFRICKRLFWCIVLGLIASLFFLGSIKAETKSDSVWTVSLQNGDQPVANIGDVLYLSTSAYTNTDDIRLKTSQSIVQFESMIELEELITSVPNADDSDAMAEWFAQCEKWATQNQFSDIKSDASSGINLINSDNSRKENRTQILARLKTLQNSGKPYYIWTGTSVEQSQYIGIFFNPEREAVYTDTETPSDAKCVVSLQRNSKPATDIEGVLFLSTSANVNTSVFQLKPLQAIIQFGSLIELEELINNTPETTNIDALAEWFARCEQWAMRNQFNDIRSDASSGINLINSDNSRKENRTQILARLKVLQNSGKPYYIWAGSSAEHSCYTNVFFNSEREAVCIDLQNVHLWDNGIIEGENICTSDRVKTYTCTRCNHQKHEVIPATKHTYVTTIKKATLTTEGRFVKKCSECGYISESFDIFSPDRFELINAVNSYNSENGIYTYTGKPITPQVKVYDLYWEVIPPSNYTVQYYDNVKVGQAKAVITFKGDYAGTKTIPFLIQAQNNTVLKNNQWYSFYVPSSGNSSSNRCMRQYKIKIEKEGYVTLTSVDNQRAYMTINLLNAKKKSFYYDRSLEIYPAYKQPRVDMIPVSKGTYYLQISSGSYYDLNGKVKYTFHSVKQAKNKSKKTAINLTKKKNKWITVCQTPKANYPRYYKIKLKKAQKLSFVMNGNYLGKIWDSKGNVYEPTSTYPAGKYSVRMNSFQSGGNSKDNRTKYTTNKKLPKGWVIICIDGTYHQSKFINDTAFGGGPDFLMGDTSKKKQWKTTYSAAHLVRFKWK